MKLRVTTKRTDIYHCKNCGYKVEVPHHLLFDAAAWPWGHFCLTAHAINRDQLSCRALLAVPLWLLILPTWTAVYWVLDVLRTVLWTVTWPFWWLHEEVL